MTGKNETNSDCPYYNMGGDGSKERPSYPTEYGARCEKHNEFFSVPSSGVLTPNCFACTGERLDNPPSV
jgi:hypothetical protein